MPEGWRRILLYEDDHGYVPRFHNEHTGEVSMSDPRLKDWPIDTFNCSPSRYSNLPDRYAVNASDLQKQGANARYINLV